MAKSAKSRAKILLCDDSVTMHRAVKLALKNENYQLMACDNGRDALRLAKMHKPDIMLVDVDMPEMNGIELSQKIRSDAEIKNTKLILLCGSFDQIDESHLEKCNADARLWKPFEASVLKSTLDTMLSEEAQGEATELDLQTIDSPAETKPAVPKVVKEKTERSMPPLPPLPRKVLAKKKQIEKELEEKKEIIEEELQVAEADPLMAEEPTVGSDFVEALGTEELGGLPPLPANKPFENFPAAKEIDRSAARLPTSEIAEPKQKAVIIEEDYSSYPVEDELELAPFAVENSQITETGIALTPNDEVFENLWNAPSGETVIEYVGDETAQDDSPFAEDRVDSTRLHQFESSDHEDTAVREMSEVEEAVENSPVVAAAAVAGGTDKNQLRGLIREEVEKAMNTWFRERLNDELKHVLALIDEESKKEPS